MHTVVTAFLVAEDVIKTMFLPKFPRDSAIPPFLKGVRGI